MLLRITIALIALTSPVAQAAEFISLGMLPGTDLSAVQSISPSGNYVSGRSGSMSFRWSRDDGMVKVSDFNTADDVTDDGLVVGGNEIDSAYRWEGGTLTIIGDLTAIGRSNESPGGARMSSAHGVSADGTILVGNTPTDQNEEADSFRIIGDLIEPIGDFPGGTHTSGIRSVSADGTIAVGYGITDAGREAMRWENGVRESLGDLAGGGLFSWAHKISADGMVIVGRSESASGTEAFRWTRETGMVGLGYIPNAASNDSRAWDLTADGSIIVGNHSGDLSPRSRDAFIWDADNGMRDLQGVLVSEFGLADELAGWDLISARGISDDGTKIAGAAFNPDGNVEAFLVDLRPVPEPSGMTLCCLAAVLVARCRSATTAGSR